MDARNKSFALSYAKDIVIARINAKHYSKATPLVDIEREIFACAWHMGYWLEHDVPQPKEGKEKKGETKQDKKDTTTAPEIVQPSGSVKPEGGPMAAPVGKPVGNACATEAEQMAKEAAV